MAEPTEPTEPTADKLHVRAPDGTYYKIDPSKAAELPTTWHVEAPQETAARQMEEQEGAIGAAKAFGENLASTATLGLSDVALGATLGNEYRQNRALREIAYPGVSTAGEIGGMVLPALATGGAGLLEAGAEGAAGAAEAGGSLLSNAARGAATAAEWSPAGLALRGGEAASELAGRGLEHLGITGESLIGKMALTGGKMAAGGAVEGAAFGAGGALSEAALAPDGDYDKLAQKLWAGGIEGAKFGALVGGGLGAGGELAGAVARKIGGTFSARRMLEDFADTKSLKSAGFQGSDLKKLTPERRAALADVIRNEDEIGWLDSLGDRSKKLTEAKEKTGELLGQMRKQLDEVSDISQRPNVARVLEDADTKVTQMMADAKTAAQEKAATEISQEIDTMRKNIGDRPMTFEEAHQLRRQLDSELTNYGKRTYPTAGSKRPPDLYEQGMMSIRTDLEREFENAAEGVMGKTSPGFRAAYEDAKSRYGALKEISSVAKKRTGSLAGNRDVSLTDTIAGVGGFAAMGPKGLLLAAANRALRSTPADHVVGELASQLARLDKNVSDSVGRFVSRSRKAAQAVESVAESPVAKRGLVKKIVNEGTKVGKSGLASTAHVTEAAPEQRERVREYYETLGHVEKESNSPPGTLVSIPGAPQIEAAAEKVRRNSIAFLMKEAPKGPAQLKNPILARIARQTDPDPVAVMKWLRKVETVENPKSVLKALEQGKLTSDHVSTLEATNPAMLEMMRRVAVEQITEKNADMSYDGRIQLQLLLGVQVDPSMRPASIQMGQAVYAARQQAAEAQKQGGQGISGKRPPGIESRMDELEGGFSE